MLEKRNVPAVVRFGPFTLDGRTGELSNGQTRLKIPDQSISILQALLENPGELVTREALRDRLWGSDTFVDFEAGLNAAVRRLREALNDSADTPRYVETLPRRGYRFIAPVEGTLTGAAPASAQSAPVEAPVSASPGIRRGGRARVRHFAIAALALAVVGVALWAGLRRNDASPTASGAARRVPITNFQGLEVDPAISPTGTLVAFAWEGESGDNFDIYVRSIDGTSQPLRLTTDAATDLSPAWSPDGQRIAFVRVLSGKRVIVVTPALGGHETPLFEAGQQGAGWVPGGWTKGLSWTPEGKHLVFGDDVSAATTAIYLYSLDDGQRRQLTRPSANFGDSHPVVSPDGRYLGFVRRGGAQPTSIRVFLQELDKLLAVGEPVQLTFDHPVQAFDWMPDSGSVVYDTGHNQPGGLWRIAVGGRASEPLLLNVRATRPSIARTGPPRVVYQNAFVDSNIWELPVPPSPNQESSAFRVIASTVTEVDPQFSPDGSRIAFASWRSGHREIWVSNRDGSDPKPVTNLEAFSGSPRWSRDGMSIAFDSARTGSFNLYVVPTSGGPIRPLTSDAFNNIRPCWSDDGRWIYFGSDRTVGFQIWKMPSAGGTAIPVTRGGGKEPIVSPDGRSVYYAKQSPTEGIWEVPTDGGTEANEVRIVSRGKEFAFDVADNGIFIMDVFAKPATVEMFSFSSRQLVPVARLPSGARFGGAPYFAVTRDGRSMLYQQQDEWRSDIEMLRDFR